MKKNRCLVCGSFELRADRGLSGRLICMSCGNPYGVRKVGLNKSNNTISSLMNNKKLFFIIIFILIFIIVII